MTTPLPMTPPSDESPWTLVPASAPSVTLPVGPERRPIAVRSIGAPVRVLHLDGETTVPALEGATFYPTPVRVPDDGEPPTFGYVPAQPD